MSTSSSRPDVLTESKAEYYAKSVTDFEGIRAVDRAHREGGFRQADQRRRHRPRPRGRPHPAARPEAPAGERQGRAGGPRRVVLPVPDPRHDDLHGHAHVGPGRDDGRHRGEEQPRGRGHRVVHHAEESALRKTRRCGWRRTAPVRHLDPGARGRLRRFGLAGLSLRRRSARDQPGARSPRSRSSSCSVSSSTRRSTPPSAPR